MKRRGKSNLILLNATWEEVKKWISEKMNQEIKINNVSGKLDTFIVEPFIEHKQSEEFYVCIQNQREGNEILFYHEGGINIGDVDSKAQRVLIPIFSDISDEQMKVKKIVVYQSSNFDRYY